MNEQWLKIKAWWTNLAKREQQAITFGALILGVFILYAGIWSPLVNHVDAMRKRVLSEQKLLLWMQAADKQIQQMKGQAKNKNHSLSPVVLLSDVRKLILQAGLEKNLTQLKQATNDSIEIHFQKVEFDRLVALLTAIVKEESVAITQMAASAEHTPGAVNADVVLKIPG